MTKLEQVNNLIEELNALEDNKPRAIKVWYEVDNGEHCIYCSSGKENITLPPLASKTIDGAIKNLKLLKAMSDSRKN